MTLCVTGNVVKSRYLSGVKTSLPRNGNSVIDIIKAEMAGIKTLTLTHQPPASFALLLRNPPCQAKTRIGDKPSIFIHFEYNISYRTTLKRPLAEAIRNRVLDTASEALAKKYTNFDLNISLVYDFEGMPYFHLDVHINMAGPLSSTI